MYIYIYTIALSFTISNCSAWDRDFVRSRPGLPCCPSWRSPRAYLKPLRYQRCPGFYQILYICMICVYIYTQNSCLHVTLMWVDVSWCELIWLDVTWCGFATHSPHLKNLRVWRGVKTSDVCILCLRMDWWTLVLLSNTHRITQFQTSIKGLLVKQMCFLLCSHTLTSLIGKMPE